MQWYYDCYGVERVGGEANVQMTATISPPNTGARVAVRRASKIILGDWNWYNQRPLNWKNVIWHNANKSKRALPLRFGDMHTEN